MENVEPVEQVGAEASLGDQSGELRVGSGDDPHVRRPGADGAEWSVLALLEQAQQFSLQRRRQVFDLVEEERAARSRLDEPGVIAVGAGEGSAEVAEEFALDELLGKRTAVHRDEGARGTRALLVESPCDEFLARAGLALDQHARVAAREAADVRSQPLDRFARADVTPARATARGRSKWARCPAARRHPDTSRGRIRDRHPRPAPAFRRRVLCHRPPPVVPRGGPSAASLHADRGTPTSDPPRPTMPRDAKAPLRRCGGGKDRRGPKRGQRMRERADRFGSRRPARPLPPGPRDGAPCTAPRPPRRIRPRKHGASASRATEAPPDTAPRAFRRNVRATALRSWRPAAKPPVATRPAIRR